MCYGDIFMGEIDMTMNVRIAPSPTGNMHFGTLRQAVHNYVGARSVGGKFHLRIDDTDVERSDIRYVDNILYCLDYMNLEYDSIVYQSSNIDRYLNISEELYKNGMAEYRDGALFLRYTDDNFIHWIDEISGTMKVNEAIIGQINKTVLIFSSGKPSYNLASVIDDYFMNINCIIRGVDHISNSPKQIVLWNYLNKIYNTDIKLPKFYHVGLVTEKGKKLSKRDSSTDISDWMSNYHKDAIFNFLLRLGWAPREDNKKNSILDRDRAFELFWDGGSLRSSPANIDWNKLNHLNKIFNR